MFEKLKDKFKRSVNRPLLITSFIIYMILALWIILFKCAIPYFCKVNVRILNKSILEAFKYTIFYLPVFRIDLTIVDIVLNSIVLLPLGIYLPVLFKNKNLKRDILIAVGLVLLIETTELFSRLGQFSFLDFIWNISGMLIGEFIYHKLENKFTNSVINYIQLFIVVFILPFAIYAIVSVALNWNLYAPIFDYVKYPYRLI